MREREINEGRNGTIWVPDTIADWDAPSHWERERLDSMEQWLKPGMTLVDVGTEHGWLTAVYGQFVGPIDRPLSNARYATIFDGWPAWTSSDGPESPTMAYRYLRDDPVEIPVITIDTIATQLALIGRRVDAITVDVEGAEMAVMRGAAGCLEYSHPIIWISVHPDMMARDFATPVEELFDFMVSYGYRRQFLATDHEQHHLFVPKRMWR